MTAYDAPGHFDRLYAEDPDPWRFSTSDYEREKYAATLDALPPGRFARAFEVGCSIGVLTRQLASRCDRLVGVDIAEAAVDQARARCAGLEGVALQRMAVPEQWPEGAFDLVLFSEVLYYLGEEGLRLAASRTLESLQPGGTVVLVNWHGPTDGAFSGDAAAEAFIAAVQPRLRVTAASRAERYRIDVLG